MRYRPLLRLLGCAALALALTPSFAPPAFGAARTGRTARPAGAVSPGTGAASWLTGLWKTIGCLVLPGATCTPPGGAQPTSDYGCGSDPDGVPRCNPSGLTQPDSDYGCSIDPNGVRRCGEGGGASPSAEYGCGSDPNGLRR